MEKEPLSPGAVVTVGPAVDSGTALLIREITFAEMCGRYDDALLIYDPDDMAEAYEERGIPWEVLADGSVKIWWPDEVG